MFRSLLAATVVVASLSVPLHAQVLTCASGGSDRCAVMHYHVQVWNADTKATTELFGINSFSSSAACEDARKADMASNSAAIAHLNKTAPRLKAVANRYGACHCDMTTARSDPHYLDQDRRMLQLRSDRDVRLALADVLVDNQLTPEAPIVRALFESPRLSSGSQWPRVVTVPEPSKVKLLDPASAALKDSTITVQTTTSPAPTSIELVEARFDPALERDVPTAEGDAPTANAFLDAEMKRMMELLGTIAQLDDAAPRERLLETINERTLLLSNIGHLVESAGGRSRLAAATGAADTPVERLRLVKQLFGDEVGMRWSPSRVADMPLTVPAAIANDPVGRLRDAAGNTSDPDRRLALYAFLSQTPTLTESQELWVTGIIEAFLKD